LIRKEKAIGKGGGGGMFIHSKERVIKKGKIKCPPQVMCGV